MPVWLWLAAPFIIFIYTPSTVNNLCFNHYWITIQHLCWPKIARLVVGIFKMKLLCLLWLTSLSLHNINRIFFFEFRFLVLCVFLSYYMGLYPSHKCGVVITRSFLGVKLAEQVSQGSPFQVPYSVLLQAFWLGNSILLNFNSCLLLVIISGLANGRSFLTPANNQVILNFVRSITIQSANMIKKAHVSSISM